MLSAKEWLLVVVVAVVGAAITMIVRAMLWAFRLASGVAIQSISALLVWALVGLAVVALLRWRTARRG